MLFRSVTVVVPSAKVLPDACVLVKVIEPDAVQLSVGIGAVQVATASQLPDAAVKEISAGQTNKGASLSVTVTVWLHVAVLPFTSVTVHTTVVVPTG